MTSRERVLGYFRREEVDLVPVVNPTSVATIESMNACGATFPGAHTTPMQMASLAAIGHETLGFDTISPYFSVQLEAAALGCEIDWGIIDSMPSIVRSPFREIEEIATPPAFLDTPPITALLAGLRILRKRYPDAAICGKVMGPLTLAYHLFGVPNVVMDILLAEQRLKDALDSLVEISIRFALAQINEGVDLLTWADHATSDLVSAKRYVDTLLPVHQRVTERLRDMVPIILHVCGNIDDRIVHLKESGFTAIQAHSQSNYRSCREVSGDDLIVLGGINNPKTLASGAPRDVEAEVDAIHEARIDLVTPECAVPPRTSNANLTALTSRARKRNRVEDR